MSFLFEYIGEMGKDYIHSVLTCLEDALTDRDQVHRQTAASIVKHLALGTAGLGVEDAHLHLLNLIFPNIFESESWFPLTVLLLPRPEVAHLVLTTASPHVIGAVLDAIEAMRVALGPGVVLAHILQGLFHPARKVREVYWHVVRPRITVSLSRAWALS
jgi:splicing factor 3B subunit 1